MHENPSSSDFMISRKWDDSMLLGLVILGVAAGCYGAATLQTPLQRIISVFLIMVAMLLAYRGYVLSQKARSQASERNALAAQADSLAAQAEQAQGNFQSIFDNAIEGIFQSTPEGSFLTANPALARMLGRDSVDELTSEMEGWPGRHFFADNVRWAELIRYVEQQDSVADFQAEVIRKDGRTIWVSQNVHAVRGEDGKIAYLEGTILDITERYWAELRKTLQYATAKILNETGSVIEARPKILQAICELLEWDMGAVWDVILPENLLRCVEIWHNQGIDISEFENASLEVTFAPGVRLAGKVWQTGEPAWIVDFAGEEYSLNALVAAKCGMNSAFGIPIKVGGEVMHVLEFFSPKASEPDPELLQMLGLIANQIGYLIERKTAEETLRDTVVRKGAILESSLDSIITFDREGKVIEWNTAAERTFGYRRQDAMGRILAELIIPESFRNSAGNGLPLYTASGAAFGRSTEIIAIRSNGQEFPAEIAISKVQVQRHPIYTVYVRDITESKRALRLRNELAAVVAVSDEAIIRKTLDGIICSWNAGAERIFGYREREVVGRPASMLVPSEEYNSYVEATNKVRNGECIENFETVRLHKEGHEIEVAISEAPIRDERGLIAGTVLSARDITEAKRIEGQLLQSQKMEAVGRLAGGVAHDFNNILTAILGYSDLLLNQLEPGSAFYKNISEIRKAGEFAASLTHQLLAFSRGQTLELKVLEINDIVSSIQPMLRRLIGEQIHLAVVPSRKVTMVRADPGQLEQVLLNLTVNARDAMPSGGVITIHTSSVDTGSETGVAFDGVPPGKWVKLMVRDTGMGMSEEVKKHVFEPFFTTKERGRGTGLGLATCYGIIKQTGGYISCESSPGLGTTFHIYLPQVEGPAGEPLSVEREFEGLDLPKGTETILLVEDERSVRKLTAHVLQKLGYTVLQAESAEDAQQIVNSAPVQNIDLLLSDVVLPNSGGKQLATWIQENFPNIRVLFTSGYVEEVVFNNYGIDVDVPFLQKPFTPVALARKVREVIEA